ncbi:hypothetical protein [Oryzobacter telluris]|uniref:hypothetical protein n=1 Tax=Oryzobacter telluris TaxID=3149179 RepID=UPI00370DC59C
MTRAQLLGNGVTKATIRWQAGRTWRVLLPCVYLVPRAEPSFRQRCMAAQLWAGPQSVLAGPTAARLHGITSISEAGTIHVLVPATHRAKRRGFADVRKSLLDDLSVIRRGSLRLSGPARAAVDAARLARTESDRSAILIEAVQRDLATVDDLAEWVFRLRTRDAASLHDALDAAASGAWSVPEAEVLTLVARSRLLSQAWANPTLHTEGGRRLVTPDVWFDDVALAVMVHSRKFHQDGDQWEDTVEKDSDLTAAGAVVVGITPLRMRRDPDATLRRVEAAYAVAAARPRPPLVAEPRIARAG